MKAAIVESKGRETHEESLKVVWSCLVINASFNLALPDLALYKLIAWNRAVFN